VKDIAACLVCGLDSTRARPRHVREDDRLVLCPGCGLLYADPQYETHELAELYSDRYYDERTASSGSSKWGPPPERLLFEKLRAALACRFPRLGEEGVRVLDFGCGVGTFLAVMRDHGADCLGVESSDMAARYVRERLDIPARTGGEDELARLEDGSFDLAVMLNVLEHLRDPKLAAALVRRKLRPGGVLAIFVPSTDSLAYRLQGGTYADARNPTHLALFSRRALWALLAKTGFRDARRLVFWGGRPGFGFFRNSLQLVARLLGLGSGHFVTAVR
jgi:2-polyprenyl-3-methyl-5-hydroxy-6-metoxy-1,4-benzoquinol methylase